jgi:hypothetical protein
MMIVKKLIALVLLVGLFTLSLGCTNSTPDTKKTGGGSGTSSPSGGGGTSNKSTP